MTSIVFLGPRGSFSEAALHQLDDSDGAELIPGGSVAEALAALRAGDADRALVPIENSIEGSVATTLDGLSVGEPLVIVAEQVISVSFTLMAPAGIGMSEIRTIGTHPHASAQCSGWLRANLPQANVIPLTSTSAAAAALAETGAGFEAAIAPRIAADIYGLNILADDIGDNHEAWTRFVLLARQGHLPTPSGADKTTLTLFMRADHPGALMEILTEFSVRGVNLTRIESRPTRKALGDYFFSLDCEGHVSDARVGEALAGLHRICADVRFLGSYPRHDGRQPLVREGVTDADFRDADQWLRSIRGDA